MEQEYPDENLFPLDHPVNTLFEDIRKAMQVTSESELSFPPPNLPPVDEENGEKSIGVITSPVLKALLHLQDVLRMKDDEESAGLETGIAATCLLCMQERDEQVKRINEIRRAQLLVQELFWAGVVEVIPAALDAEAVNLRRDWTVVSCPIDERIPSFAELLNGLGWDTGRSVQIVRTKQIEL